MATSTRLGARREAALDGPVCPAIGIAGHASGRTAMHTVAIAALLSASAPASAWAFHEGGAGFCLGCHEVVETAQHVEVRPTLLGADASSTCLRCHASSTSVHTPAGSFEWTTKTFSWIETGVRKLSAGDSHGHNVVASEYGMFADQRFTTAPGGRFPARAMGCTSCHDPHGRLASAPSGAPRASTATPAQLRAEQAFAAAHRHEATGPAPTYRMLASTGYVAPGSNDAFTRAAPIAEAFGSTAETDADHPIYVSGMSEWCGNCHGALLHGGRSHASGAAIGAAKADTYRALTRRTHGAQGASGYFALVPFETGTPPAGPSAMLDGPTANARVMCLSCHRGHASAFPSAGRWDFDTTFIARGHPLQGDDGAGPSDALDAYQGRDLGRELGRYQRQLCTTCHALD